MKKGIKTLCVILVLAVAFVAGWKLMPKASPWIKNNIVYPVFPGMKPTPAPTQEPYQPAGGTGFDEAIVVSDSLIYYFYKDYCPWCRQLEPLTSGLPKQITLPDGTKSDVKLVCLNKVEDRFLQIITGYYEENGIPEERQYVPAIVIGDRYLFTGEEIIGQLMDALMVGEGLKTPLLDGGQRIQ